MGDGTVAISVGRLAPVTSQRDDAIASLFDLHYRRLSRLATLLLGDRFQAEEAVQEAFVRTYAGWLRIRRPEHAERYLRAAVVNQCRSLGRRRSRAERATPIVSGALPTEVVEGSQEGAGDALVVLAAVRALPNRQREAVVLTYYADLSVADVARALGCSTGTVKSQLSKARATLGHRLGEDLERAVEAPR